ncbi:unnamed protein product, partial [Nesidiocoris tenuis]
MDARLHIFHGRRYSVYYLTVSSISSYCGRYTWHTCWQTPQVPVDNLLCIVSISIVYFSPTKVVRNKIATAGGALGTPAIKPHSKTRSVS